jgi:uncharacterized protein
MGSPGVVLTLLCVSTAAIERQPIGSDEVFALTVSDWQSAAAPFVLQGTLTRMNDGLSVRMEGHWQAQASCDRCLRPVTVAVGGETTALTTEGALGETWLPVVDQEIDLTPLVEEIEILSWPTKVLCAEDCRGLCPNCGQDLNQKRCLCAEVLPPGPFDQLRDLLGKDD